MPEGRARQDELLAVCRAAGMRMVGPNCLGVANLHHQTALNATFAPGEPTPGSVAFASQSGAFGIAAIDEAAARGIGLSSFVSMGDKADLSGNDFLEYWEQDPDTAVLLLYLESFGNPRRFGRIARRITKNKPIVAVKSGRTAAGQRAASSHTGALLAASDVTVDALFAHAGVLRAETVGEMFDVAGLLARQPLPRGGRVAVLTNAGGPGILAPTPARPRACGSSRCRRRRARGSPRRCRPRPRPRNPVDMIASATAEQYERSLRILLEDDEVDAVVTIFVRPLAARAAEVARAHRRRRRRRRPAGARRLARRRHARAPRTRRASRASRRPRRRCGRWPTPSATRAAARPPDDPPFEAADADIATAATIVAEGSGSGGGWLPPDEVERLLRCWGIPVVASRLVALGAGRGPRRRGARRPGRAQGGRARPRAQERRGRRAPRARPGRPR